MSEAEKHRVRRAALGLLSAGAAAGAGCLSWALHEAHRYILRERVLVLPHVANAAGELRILHLSDMHLLRRHRAKQQFLRELGQRCRPDLVVLTGDHLSEAGAVGPLLDALAPLADIPGLFVYGSNDYFAPVLKNPLRYVAPGLFPPLVEKGEPDLPWEEMTAGLEAFGWIDLNNQRARLRAAAWDIDAVGMDDPHIGRARMPRPGEATDALEGGAAAEGNTGAGREGRKNSGRGYLRLGVVHAPYRAALAALMNDGAALTLAGHTHGGQLAVPGFGALTTNCDLPLRYDSGLFDWPCGEGVGAERGAGGADSDRDAGGDRAGERLPLRGDGVRVLRGSMAVNVSAGLGTSPYTPVRFLRPPEAILLRVRGGAD